MKNTEVKRVTKKREKFGHGPGRDELGRNDGKREESSRCQRQKATIVSTKAGSGVDPVRGKRGSSTKSCVATGVAGDKVSSSKSGCREKGTTLSPKPSQHTTLHNHPHQDSKKRGPSLKKNDERTPLKPKKLIGKSLTKASGKKQKPPGKQKGKKKGANTPCLMSPPPTPSKQSKQLLGPPPSPSPSPRPRKTQPVYPRVGKAGWLPMMSLQQTVPSLYNVSELDVKELTRKRSTEVPRGFFVPVSGRDPTKETLPPRVQTPLSDILANTFSPPVKRSRAGGKRVGDEELKPAKKQRMKLIVQREANSDKTSGNGSKLVGGSLGKIEVDGKAGGGGVKGKGKQTPNATKLRGNRIEQDAKVQSRKMSGKAKVSKANAGKVPGKKNKVGETKSSKRTLKTKQKRAKAL